jgi:hypothetical protein
MKQTQVDTTRAGIALAEMLADGDSVSLPRHWWRHEAVAVAQEAYNHGASRFTLLDSATGAMWIVPGLPSEGSVKPGDTLLYVAPGN